MTTHAGYFLLLNVAMGGAFPNGVAGSATPTAATVPGRPMVVDYVAVYDAGGGTPPDHPAADHAAAGGTRDAYATDPGRGVQRAERRARRERAPRAARTSARSRNGDWAQLRQRQVRLAPPPRDFVARVASGAGGGVSGLVEVRLDSPTATPDRQLRDRQHRRLAELAHGARATSPR